MKKRFINKQLVEEEIKEVREISEKGRSEKLFKGTVYVCFAEVGVMYILENSGSRFKAVKTADDWSIIKQ